MHISVDISLYPLADDYVELVCDFIARIEGIEGVSIAKNTLSTQIFGEYKTIMALLETEMERTFHQLPYSVFVLKIVGLDRTPNNCDC